MTIRVLIGGQQISLRPQTIGISGLQAQAAAEAALVAIAADRELAEGARDAAQEAQGGSETARDGAVSARDEALGYRNEAETFAGQSSSFATAASEQLAVVEAAGAAQIVAIGTAGDAAIADVEDAAAANFYDDAAAGIAGTVDGQWFKTVEDGRIVTYKNVSEVAVEKSEAPKYADLAVATEAAADAVAAAVSLNDRLELISASGAVFAVRVGDSPVSPSSQVTAYQDAATLAFMLPDTETGVFASVQDTMRAATLSAGTRAIDATVIDGFAGNWTDNSFGLHLLGLSGTVQENILGLATTIETAVADEAARVNLSTMRAMFEGERTRALGVAGVYHNSIIKPDGSDGTETQRIPGLVVLSTTTAALFWQQRLAGYGYDGDAQYQRLVGALVTYTPGVGVSAGATVVIDEPSDPTKVSNHPHPFLNEDGDIVLLYNNNDHGSGTGQYKVFCRIISPDLGTIGEREEVVDPLPGGNSMALGSNGTVVQVPADYPNAGRWLVPVYGSGESGNFSGVIFSDDDGVSWEVGPLLYNGLTIQEPSIALTHEGDLLMAMRRADDPYLVHFARLPLADGDAAEWVDMGLNASMVTATCDMSMVQVAEGLGDGVPCIAHCGPSSIARRAQRIRLSYDCGRSWQWQFQRPDVGDNPGDPGYDGAGYTSIKMLDRGLFIVAYETAASSADDSDIGVYVVNLEKVLTDGSRL